MDLNAVVTSYTGRIVAFVVTPILLPLVGAFAVWVQDVLGVDLSPTELTGYVVSVVTGVALLAWGWLRNRGRWEVAIAELEKLRQQGDLARAAPTTFIPPAK